MKKYLRSNAIQLLLCLVFPVFCTSVTAQEPYPSVPVALSTSVPPNIMLYIDTSGSMLQDANNNWLTEGLCKLWNGIGYDDFSSSSYPLIWDTYWASCVNGYSFTVYTDAKKKNPYTFSGGSAYRTAVDADQITKMSIARTVAKNVVNANSSLRFGLFTFDDSPASTGFEERTQAGKLRYDVSDMSVAENKTALFAALDAMHGRTGTPLAEGLLDITRYFEGKQSLYKKDSSKNYIQYKSPIQYRCQKNFVILVTDGEAFDDQNLPGSTYSGKDKNPAINAMPYTARDSTGKAITGNSFSVCSASNSVTANGSNINCPANLDGTTTGRDFGDKTNMPSAVRDVAMYANVADLRVGGVDLYKQSFDDPIFSKQNLNTYTVGFSVNNPVLPATALVGGGKYYSANDQATLSAALSNAVNNIVSSISNGGGLATTAPYKVTGSKLFQPIFIPDGWTGELRCYDYANVKFDTTGKIIAGACAAPKAVIPAETSRNIWSSKWYPTKGQSGTATATSGEGAFQVATTGILAGVPCSPGNDAATTTTITCDQQLALGGNAVDQLNTLKFLRGVDGATLTANDKITKLRSRTTLLGDITDSQPLVIAAPSGSTTDTAYDQFKSDYSSRSVVFVGANDGMLHAFSTSDMKEIMGYAPSSVYPHLDDLTKADYGLSVGTAHVYGVNGALRQADVKLGDSWKTILVGGLAQGGQGYFAVDATSSGILSSSTASPVKWEWNDQHDNEMGYTFGAPLIYNVRTSTNTAEPAVVLVNGYENSYDDTTVGGKKNATNKANTSALYIVRADTGVLIKKIAVPDGGGLSSPAGGDVGQDGVLDYVYAGDINGKLWRFDLTNADSSKWSVSANPIFDAGTTQPITLRPAIKAIVDENNKSRGNLVLFGTGKFLTRDDVDLTKAVTQSFYAVQDDLVSTATVPKTSLVTRTIDSLVVTVANKLSSTRDGSYRAIAPVGDSLDLSLSGETKKGWYLDLPVKSERLVSSPILLDNMVLFGTGTTDSSDKCLSSGSGWIMGLNPLTGRVTANDQKKEYSFVDVKLDGVSTDADQLSFTNGKAFVSGYSTKGIPTELSYVADALKVNSIDAKGGDLGNAGNAIALQEVNMMAVYTANGVDGVTTGKPMGRPGPDMTSGLDLVYGTKGNDVVIEDRLNSGGGSGTPQCIPGVNCPCVGAACPCTGPTCTPTSTSPTYTIETTIWREIK